MNLTTKLIGLGALAAVLLVAFKIATPNQEAAIVILPAHAQQVPPGTTTVAAAGVILHSDKVDWPASDRMFPGPDADAINNNCLACHSAGMVLTQPRLTRDTWDREVEKMRQQYKAPVSEDDVPAIVAWLVSHKGVK